MRFKQYLEQQTLSAGQVLAMIQRSPQSSDIDWLKYAERWGITDTFVYTKVSVDKLVQLNHNFRLGVSQNLDRNEIERKKNGSLNPVIITAPKNEVRPLFVVDGTHSLVAAYERGDKEVDAIISQDALRFL